jgi:DNA-binding response OmpR family regulator
MQFETPPLIIAISGLGRDEDRQRSVAAGCDHHAVKPADPRWVFDSPEAHTAHLFKLSDVDRDPSNFTPDASVVSDTLAG